MRKSYRGSLKIQSTEQYQGELNGQRILVTGGAGFIGSNLVDRLCIQNNKVIVLDNLYSGLLSNLGKSRDAITFIKGDTLDKRLLKDIVSEVEFVFHLATDAGSVKSIKDPNFYMEADIRGTINLLKACVGSNIKRLVYSSSAAVYGEARYLPVDENHPLSPESSNGVSKLAAEKYCFAFHRVHGLPVTVLRYFNAYGPKQGSSGHATIIPRFFSNIRNGEPLTIIGDGEQTRDFVFVGDIAKANILAAAHPYAVGEIFNIATGRESSVNQLVSIINKVSGQNNEVIHAASKVGEVKHSRADVEKARMMLGYNPGISLKEGIPLTWQEEMAMKKR